MSKGQERALERLAEEEANGLRTLLVTTAQAATKLHPSARKKAAMRREAMVLVAVMEDENGFVVRALGKNTKKFHAQAWIEVLKREIARVEKVIGAK